MTGVNLALSLLDEIHRDQYVALYADPRGPMTRVVRSSVPFPSTAVAVACYERVVQVIDQLGRTGRVVLTDMRLSAGRNDPEFEEAMNRLRPQLYRGMVRIGVLVKTATGALQIRRLVQEDGIERRISTDEAELLEYLRTGR